MNSSCTLRRRLCLAMPAALLAACATGGGERLSIQLLGASVSRAVATGERVSLALRIQNRGPADITIDGLALRVEVDGVQVATGVSDGVFVVPRFGEIARDVETTAAPPGLLLQVLAGRRQTSREAVPTIRYRVSGTAHRAGRRYTPDPGTDIPFEGFADLPLPADAAGAAR